MASQMTCLSEVLIFYIKFVINGALLNTYHNQTCNIPTHQIMSTIICNDFESYSFKDEWKVFNRNLN